MTGTRHLRPVPAGQRQHVTGPDDGAALLDELRAAITRYVILPSEHAEVGVTLWIAATHASGVLHHAPRLAIRSPEKRCGKTRLLDVIVATANRALPTANISAAVLYRVMGGDDPRTLVIDEADTVWGTKKTAEQNEDLRGLVNAGFERGRPTLRYDAAARRVEELETFGFVALAGIGTLPDTITDRAVNIVMRRRRAGEQVDPYRSQRDGGPLAELGQRLKEWATEHREHIGKAEPDLPVEDRAADVWESLVAVADQAGGAWPALARAAAVALSDEHDQDDAADSSSLQLLTDIRAVFDEAAVAFLASKQLVNALRALDDGPWSEEVDLTTHKLARRLRPFGIVPKPNETGKVRGYHREHFRDTFDRYLGEESSETVKASNPQVSPSDTLDGLTVQSVKADRPSDGLSSQLDGLTVPDDWAAQAYEREW